MCALATIMGHIDRKSTLIVRDRWIGTEGMEHEAGVEPACFGFKAQRGCRQPTARVLDQAAGIGPAWAAFRAQLGCQQPPPERSGGPSRNRTLLTGFGDQSPPRGQPELAESGEPESHAARGTVCFPDSAPTPPGSL